MTIRSSSFAPVYNTNPDTGNLIVEMTGSINPGQPGQSIPNATTSIKTIKNSSTTSQIMLTANTNNTRVFVTMRNNSTSNAYVNLGATAAIDDVYKLSSQDIITITNYTGPISAIWQATPFGEGEFLPVSGNMIISEALI